MAIINWQYGTDTPVSEVHTGQMIEVYPGKVLQIWQIVDSSINLPDIWRSLILSDGSKITFGDRENDIVKALNDQIYIA